MKTAIVTRYNEKIDWIEYIIDTVDQVIVYNKGNNDDLFKTFVPPAKVVVLKMENIGRIDHSLAHYIVENWENLPDTIINLPGSILMCLKKGAYLNAMRKRFDIVKERYNGFYSPRFYKVNPNTFNYSIQEYQAEGYCNKNDNPFIKSEYPDFIAWKNALIDDRPIRYTAMRGMFVVSKENVLHIKKGIYENLLKSLSVGDNIENGHFAERIWGHLFRQYSFDKIEKTETCDFVKV